MVSWTDREPRDPYAAPWLREAEYDRQREHNLLQEDGWDMLRDAIRNGDLPEGWESEDEDE